jgi:hypothetical protein
VLALGPGRRRDPAGLAHPVPQPAGGPQPGDRGELVGAGGEPELQLAEGVLHRQPALGERPQVRDAGRHRAAELLDRGGTRVGEDGAVDDDGAQPGMGLGPAGEVGQAPEVLLLPRRGLHTEGVQAQAAARREIGTALHQGKERLGRRDPALHRHRGQVQVDVGEDLTQGVDRHGSLAEHQPQRGDAVLQVGDDRLPGQGHVRVGVPLPDVPATGDRRLPRRGRPIGTAGRGDPGRTGPRPADEGRQTRHPGQDR